MKVHGWYEGERTSGFITMQKDYNFVCEMQKKKERKRGGSQAKTKIK